MSDAERVTVLAELAYRDPEAALQWLADAFCFQTRMVVKNPDGQVVFAETGLGGCTVAVIPADPHLPVRSPLDTGGMTTQVVQMRFSQDLDAHCARARAAGAAILSEPQTLFFGDRTYIAADLEGHVWNLGQRSASPGGPPPPGWSVSYPSGA